MKFRTPYLGDDIPEHEVFAPHFGEVVNWEKSCPSIECWGDAQHAHVYLFTGHSARVLANSVEDAWRALSEMVEEQAAD